MLELDLDAVVEAALEDEATPDVRWVRVWEVRAAEVAASLWRRALDVNGLAGVCSSGGDGTCKQQARATRNWIGDAWLCAITVANGVTTSFSVPQAYVSFFSFWLHEKAIRLVWVRELCVVVEHHVIQQLLLEIHVSRCAHAGERQRHAICDC